VLAARQATSLPPGAPAEDPASELKRIEKLVRNSDLVAADRAVDALLTQAKNHPRGMATKAWILLLKAQKAHTKVPREVLDLAKRALAESPEEARALLVRGLYYKNEDKLQNALACFRKAAKADPMDIDARREAHLLSRQLGVAE
jgi:tetratricopeptide (TPR) repeat protein